MERRKLSELLPGQQARLEGLRLPEPMRSRLGDLGWLPGEPVCCMFTAPFGEPRVYRVQGTAIALRRQQASEIDICTEGEDIWEGR